MDDEFTESGDEQECKRPVQSLRRRAARGSHLEELEAAASVQVHSSGIASVERPDPLALLSTHALQRTHPTSVTHYVTRTNHEGETLRYEYRNASGRVCCFGDGPEQYLCEDCRRRHGHARTAQTPPTKVLRTDSEWNAHFAEMLGVCSLVLETPDGYQVALCGMGAPAPSTPEDDASYQVFGTPPDGYKIALASARQTGTPGLKENR